jgi:hypothetical protein
MPRPQIEPHLLRLLTSEQTFIGGLFNVNKDGSGDFYCTLYAPGDSPAVVLNPNSLYAHGQGPTVEDAIHNTRAKLWKGL